MVMALENLIPKNQLRELDLGSSMKRLRIARRNTMLMESNSS